MARFILSGMLGQRPMRFELKAGRQVLGRSSACDVVVPDPAVSKEHAEIEVAGTAITVRDLQSRNGTFINEVPVQGEQVLAVGDALRLGHLVLRVKDQEHSTITRLAPEQSTASSLSTSIEEARTMAGVDRAGALVGAVHEAGQLLSRRMRNEELYETLLEILSRFIRADRVLIIAGDNVETEPQVIASRMGGADLDEPLRISRTMMREVVDKKRSFLTKDAASDARFSAQESIIASGVHSAMAAPLFDNDRILGVVYLDSRSPFVAYGSDELQLLTLLANMMAVKITNSRLEQAEADRERLVQELQLATRIQKNLLPQTLPHPSGYDIFAFQAPCYEVGGDLYDVRLAKDGRVWLVLGDVTGKGMGAALLMANAMAGLQILEEELREPLELVDRFHRHLKRQVDPGQFITLFAGLLDPGTGRIDYVNAGHNPPVILKEGSHRCLDSTGIPVALLPDYTWTAATCMLEAGESLVVYSDGLTETMAGDVQYDEGRWQEFLARSAGLPSREFGEKLVADVNAFRGSEPVADDLTLLVVRRL